MTTSAQNPPLNPGAAPARKPQPSTGLIPAAHGRRGTIRRAGWTAFALGLGLLAGCDDGESAAGFEAQIVAEPAAMGNAPLQVALRAASNGPLDGDYIYAWSFGDGDESAEENPSHTYTAAGDFTAAVTIKVGSLKGTAELPITVAPPADLAIDEVAFSPRRAAGGAEIKVAYGLRNDGAPVLGTYRVTVFLATGPELSASVRTLFETTIEGDPTGANAGERTLTLPADLASGDFYVGVAVDPEARVGDRDRANNVRFADLQLQVRNPTDNGPDLVACGLAVPAFDGLPIDQVPVAQLGDQIEAEVCMANLGNQPLAVAGYALFLVAADDESRLIEVGRRSGFALGSGDQETFNETIDLPAADAAGLWYLRVVADPDDEVAEQREDNNERQRSSPIELAEPGEVAGIDLAVVELSVETERVYWGQAITGTLRLVNRGDTAVGRAFVVRFFAAPLDGSEAVQVGSLNLQAFAALSEETYDLQLTVSRRIQPGDYRLRVEVDPSNSVDDVNPSNNRRTLQTVLTLGGEPDFDLVTTAATFSPMQVEAGSAIDVRGTVSNPGTDATGGFELAVVLSADDVFDASDRVIGTWPASGIAGGESLAFSESVVVPVDLDQQVETWRVGLWADPANRLSGERDETNNLAIAPEALTVTGATGGCAEDQANEPNDLVGQAVAIAPGTTEGLGLCDDADWFRVAVPANAGLEVTARWTGGGTMVLQLTDAEGAPIATGEGTGTARMAFVAPSAEPRDLRIHLTADRRLQYDLDTALIEAGNQPGLRPRRVAVSPGLAVAGAPVEVRFEAVNIGGAAAPAFAAAIELVPANGAPRALGNANVAALGEGEAREVVTTVNLPADLADGLYRVRVTLDPAGVVDEANRDDNVADTALRIDAEQACAVDAFEPNLSGLAGGLPRAAALTPGVHANLTACDDDDDWYAVTLAEGQRLRADIRFTNANGDLELELYARDGTTRLARSAGFADTEAVELLRAMAAGDYFVRVVLNPADQVNSANTYTLTLTVDAANACPDDAFEPNATRETAVVLPDGAHDLTLCPGDQDWFRFNIPAGNAVSFQVAGGAADVRIALFSPAGELLAEDGRRIAYQAVVSGLHTLRVQVASAVSVPYALTVAGVSGVDLEVLTVRLSSSTVANGDGLRVDTNVTNNRGDTARNVLVRYLLSNDTLPSADDTNLAETVVPAIEGGLVTPISQRVRIPAMAAAGNRFIVVDVDPLRAVPDLRPANNRGSAGLTVNAACIDDDDRDNEGPATATPLVLLDGLLEDGVICPFTEDWFVLPAVPAGMVTLQLGFDHAQGDLDLSAWNVAGNLLAESATEAAPETVTFAHAGGDLLIRVDGFLDARNLYQLTWTLP